MKANSLSGQNTSFQIIQGGNTNVKTGDSNTSGTVITGVNSNLSGVTVTEFNVTDNQNGDIVLDPSSSDASCVANCW